uniref:ABC transporter substrate-binding protein n=1 Tax=Nitratireductor sp. CH_MIT9313-5 TaxID=3107764 RepID=UPI00300A6A24
MRKLIATAFAAVSLLVASPAFSQTPPNVLIVGQIAEPKSLDPHAVTAVNDFRILMNVYDGLTRYKDGTLEVEPALAESWEISDDGLTYTFKLREGVEFHDGTPLNAEAVKFNFDRMLDEDNPYHETGPFPLAFYFSAVDEVTAVDDLTVAFKLKEPFAPFLSNLAYPTGLIVSPEAVKKSGKDFGRSPVGTGAFKFEEWQANSRVVITRNED